MYLLPTKQYLQYSFSHLHLDVPENDKMLLTGYRYVQSYWKAARTLSLGLKIQIMVKSTDHFSRGPSFYSQHPRSSSQLFYSTPRRSDSLFLASTRDSCGVKTNMQAKSSFTYNKSYKQNKTSKQTKNKTPVLFLFLN